MLFHGASTVISRVAYIWDDGRIFHDGCSFGLLEVEDFCEQLVRMIDAVWSARLLLANGVMPAVNPSDTACKYCPAIASCPAHTNFAKAMLGRLQSIAEGPELSSLTDEERGVIWEEAKKAEKIVEGVLASLKKMAAQAAIPVGDKYEVRPMDRSKTYFDDSKARGLIVQLLGQMGETEEEIQAKLKGLTGKTSYVEFRKVKRQLPMVG
jgi:hypothetical protein